MSEPDVHPLDRPVDVPIWWLLVIGLSGIGALVGQLSPVLGGLAYVVEVVLLVRGGWRWLRHG